MYDRFILRKKKNNKKTQQTWKNIWCELGHFLCLHTCHESQPSQGQQQGRFQGKNFATSQSANFLFSMFE